MEGIECRTKTNTIIEGVIKVKIWHLMDNQAWHIDKIEQIQTILNQLVTCIKSKFREKNQNFLKM